MTAWIKITAVDDLGNHHFIKEGFALGPQREGHGPLPQLPILNTAVNSCPICLFVLKLQLV